MSKAEEASANPKDRRRLLAGALVVALGVAAACSDDGNGSSADVDEPAQAEQADLLGPEDAASGDPIRIGMVSDGATDAYDNRDELRAAEATAEYWNTHHGGLGGRPIEVVTCETGGQPGGATDCGNRMVEDGVVAVALSQSGVAESLWEPLHDAGVPTLFFQTNGEGMLTDRETSFVMTNPVATFFGVPAAVAHDEGADKVAFVNIDVPVALTMFESGAADQVMDNAGLDYELVKVAPGTADMTSQMQQVVESGADVVHIIGNDAFCIAALQGLNAVGYDGQVTSIVQCITEATREAIPGDQLDGISITATQAVGATDDPAYQRYEAVMSAFGGDVADVDNSLAMGGYTVMASLATALDGLDGEVTPEAAAEAIRTMPEADFPGAAGLTFRCGGSAFPEEPAVCTNQSLRATLDAGGEPTGYEPVDATELLQGL